jgi:hypothetical protein
MGKENLMTPSPKQAILDPTNEFNIDNILVEEKALQILKSKLFDLEYI